MSKILLLALGLFIVCWIFKAYKKKIERGSGKPAPTAEDMVRCAQCGVHLPRSQSISSGTSFYCSAEHQRADQKAD